MIGRERRALLAVLGLFGLVLLVTAVQRGVFLIDENNYMVSAIALRQGRLTAPHTEGLPPSAELEYFDPGSRTRRAHHSPVPLSTPPLYAPLAAPFSLLGWPGLVLVNVLSLLGALWALFGYARRHAHRSYTPWLAVALLGVGSYCIEYAQGVWPQMLAMALCFGAVVLASRTADDASGRGGRWWLAPLVAGLLAGFGTGVRYQNILFAACVGLGVLVWGSRRIADSALYGAGVALPLGACSAFNYVRLGWLNPIKKQPGYLNLDGRISHGPSSAGGVRVMRAGPGGLLEPLWTFWAKVVDFSFHPLHSGGEERTWMPKDPRTGAFIYLGALKKAWLQSAPWLVLGLVGLGAAWARRRGAESEPADEMDAGQGATTAARELRRLSLIVAPVLGVFSLAGFSRDDGMCFNQRYFIELLPLLAVASAWILERLPALRPRLVAIGVAAGGVAALSVLTLDADDVVRQLALLKLPLLLAALLGLCWLLVARLATLCAAALPVLLGASVAWAAGVHLGDDVTVSREVRRLNRGRLEAVERVLPPAPGGKSAVFAHFTSKDALGPLQLDHDVVIADTHLDGGKTAPALVEALLGQGRRVFVLAPGFRKQIFERMARGRAVRPVRSPGARNPVLILELGALSSPASRPAKGN